MRCIVLHRFHYFDIYLSTLSLSPPPPPLQADVVLVVGARLNWILHFGEPPRWNPQATFILVDVVQVRREGGTRPADG